MTKAEVAKLLAFITATYPNVDIRDGTVEAWHELLGDLPWEVALAATKKVLAEQEIPCLPAVGKIRQAAAQISLPWLLAPAEAWAMVSRTVSKYGFYRKEQALATLPQEVRQAVECVGWENLCHSEEPEIIRAQFLRVYEQYAVRARQEITTPPDVRSVIDRIAEQHGLPEGAKLLVLPGGKEHGRQQT